MIDHVILNVSDYEASLAFYGAALGALGFTPGMEYEGMRAFDYDARPLFWIVQRGETAHGTHVAFPARSRAEVDAFHAAALAAGGRDNGAPGLREDYHPTYYAAFALDPDGNNIEAVVHAPEEPHGLHAAHEGRETVKARRPGTVPQSNRGG